MKILSQTKAQSLERKRSSEYEEVHHSLLSGKKVAGSKIKKREEEKKKKARAKGKKRTRASFLHTMSAFFSRKKPPTLSVILPEASAKKLPEIKVQKEPIISPSEKHIEVRIRTARSRLRFALPFALPVGILALVPWTLHLFPERANAIRLYPALCLGGWENPKNAEGAPTLPPKSSPGQFNDRNSAVLRNSLAQIFCGDFTNAFPADAFPKKMFLRFSWATIAPAFPHVLELPAKSAVKDSSAVFDGPLTITGEATGTANLTTTTASSTVEEKPISFLEKFLNVGLNIAFATTASGTPDMKISSSTASTSEPVGFLVASSSEETAVPVSEKPKVAGADFLQVLYTLDGENWKQLGMVTRENLADLSFQVPVSNPEALAHFQVSIQNVISLDDPPVIYLDGMWLEAGE